MKIVDERETQKTKKKKAYKDRKEQGEWFCCAFKLGFLQLIYKASLMFKSNVELALSIILKEN